MRRTSQLAALTLILALALPCAARAQYVIGARDSLAARVDSVFRAFDRTDGPGCAVGVYRNDSILYARGYGMASLELGVPITPRTVFDIGSISKQFAATAILLLVQQGKLSLDDDIRRFVPEMPPYASGVTIRNLLNHTSGIRDYLTLLGLTGRSYDGVSDTLDYLRWITRSARTNFPIGTRYLYSNSGFALLGQIVYRVSGQSLPVFLRARVFGPLGMRDTRSLDDHTQIVPNRAQGYWPRGSDFRLAMSNVDGTGGAGSVHTTVEDFARWNADWDSAKVGGRALVEALQVRGKLKNDSTISYALGVVVDSWRGLRTVSHGGAWEGYRAHFVRFPDQHLGVATFCNVSNSGPDTLALKTAAVYLGRDMGPDTLGAWDSALTSAAELSVPPVELRRYEGVWRNETEGVVRRTRLAGDTLLIEFGARNRLVPIGPDRFRAGRLTGEIRFDSAVAGMPARMAIRSRAGTLVLHRVPGVTLAPAQLAEYLGDYRNEEIETTWSLAADSAGLAIRVNGRRLAMLVPAYRDGFSSDVGDADFTRDARGRITGLVLQAGRVRDLPFTRLH